MIVNWTKSAIKEYNYWQKTNPKISNKINELISSCEEDPFKGIGKPEPLKNDLKGFWSRRITKEHRFVYQVIDKDTITIIQCMFHY